MDRNVYTPPSTNLTETSPSPSAARPAEVMVACCLIAGSLVLGWLDTVFFLPVKISPDLMLATMTVVAVLYGRFIHKLWIGRNWARFTYAVLFLTSIPFSIHSLMKVFATSPTFVYIGVIPRVFEVGAFYFMFANPGRRWFAPK